MSARIQFALALVLDIVGAGATLLLAGRGWQTVVTLRSAQFFDDVLQVKGRTVDSGPTAFALVALAGGLAVIATRGRVRRVVGAVVGLAGLGVGWRVLLALPAISTARARELVRAAHPSASSTTDAVHVTTHPASAVLSLVAGVLIVAAGVLVVLRGASWRSMSARYESPTAPADPDAVAQARARSEAALWNALDRGDDPTARDPGDRQ